MHRGNYRKAFLDCRKHRLDLSILVEHDPERFLKAVPSFVEQLDDTDYLNLFLTNLGYVVVNYLVPNCVLTVKHPFRQTMQDTEKLAGYCDAVRIELESRDLARYVNSILTAFVVKRPPDHEAALSLLHRLRGIVFKK